MSNNNRTRYPLISRELSKELDEKVRKWHDSNHAAYCCFDPGHTLIIAEYLANQMGYTLFPKRAKE